MLRLILLSLSGVGVGDSIPVHRKMWS